MLPFDIQECLPYANKWHCGIAAMVSDVWGAFSIRPYAAGGLLARLSCVGTRLHRGEGDHIGGDSTLSTGALVQSADIQRPIFII